MDELENNQYIYDDYDDDVRDPDYKGDNKSNVDIYESDEEEEGVNLDVVRRQGAAPEGDSGLHGSSH
jgi:hypothetical protein